MVNNLGNGTKTSRTSAPFIGNTNTVIKENTQFSEANLLEKVTESKNLMKDTNPSKTIPSPQNTTNQSEENRAQQKGGVSMVISLVLSSRVEHNEPNPPAQSSSCQS